MHTVSFDLKPLRLVPVSKTNDRINLLNFCNGTQFRDFENSFLVSLT